ncbi:hypothetical protein M5K25_021535 [Dendrobium thyrsiflorum]|uniref:Uncharacterized protein n=1 Tax=Dendrobium thyrsiflorum TaxID=117978 RepID=A0ABD0UJK3_DENTH
MPDSGERESQDPLRIFSVFASCSAHSSLSHGFKCSETARLIGDCFGGGEEASRSTIRFSVFSDDRRRSADGLRSESRSRKLASILLQVPVFQ